MANKKLPQYLRDKILSYCDQMWRDQRGGSPGALGRGGAQAV